jgi:hypothetical protein
MKTGCKAVFENVLCFTVRDKDGKVYVQGKRVPKDFPLSYEERRAYIKGGPIKCVKTIMERRGLSLRQAKDLYDTVLSRGTGK